ncbi:MAG: Maf family protein [Alphaproteobacteria bacterium]|jgi:septum formation protein|nr:Maf family protein [Alphaproteobacteria bacterium]
MRLILASQSRFRAGLLAAAGVAVETMPAHVDEADVKQAARAEGASAEETALLLASLKAERIARRHPDALVIGGDQMLVCEGTWFDKPPDMAAARAQLLALRGKAHTLVTAVLCQRGDQRVWQHIAKPRLVMRDFSEAFLDQYLALEGEVLTTTVGAYRVEGPGLQLFDRIEGEHSEIVGLPMLALLGFLRQHGVLVR